jgi:hypothetical protein
VAERLCRGDRVLRDSDVKDHTGHGADVQRSDGDVYPDDLSEVMDFSTYNLRTTVRLIVLSGECRRIEVKRRSKQGNIYIKAGEIYRAVTDENEGDAAFFEILGWDRAIHRDYGEDDPPERNIRIATTVLLEAMKSQAYAR